MKEIVIKPVEVHIKIPRGRTLSLKIQSRTEKNEIIKEKVDEMYITFKKSEYSKKILFQKRLDNNTIKFNETDFYYRFVIESTDTENLDYTTYHFDVDIKRGNNRDTLVYGSLEVTEKITSQEDRGVK